MGRIFEPAFTIKKPDKINPILKNTTVAIANEGCLKAGIACEVNDGQRVHFVDDWKGNELKGTKSSW